jgi:multimeric flavodoxin WrbA
MKTLLIVFHSVTGGTRQMAEAAAQGANQAAAEGANHAAAEGVTQGGTWEATQGVFGESEVNVRLLAAADAGAADVLGADGYLFATPENLAAMAGRMKDFFDRTYYPALDRVNGRPYAALICAGSDGNNAARQIARIATGWRLRPVCEALIVRTNAQTPEAILAPKVIGADDLARCHDLGAALAGGLAAGIF